MSLAVLVYLTLFTSQAVAVSEFSKHLLEFNDFERLSSFGISPKCIVDITTFAVDLRTFMATLKSCVSQGGCTAEQRETLDGKSYAAKQLDSFGKLPAGIMEMAVISPGSYIECKELVAPYETHYCYAAITFSNLTNSLIGQMGVKVAVCMPASCTEQDIPILLRTVVKQTELPLGFPYATCVPNAVQPTLAFWIFMSFMALFVLWAIAASIVDYLLESRFPYEEPKSKTAPVRFFLAFSFYTNAALLLDTRPPKEGTLRSLSSIRFLSMTWVVAGHTLGQNAFSDTMRPVLSLWNSLLSTTFTNAFLSVDTFFLLSGVLVSYLFFKAPPSSRFVRSPFTWTLFYVHRYLRLTPPLMMFIGLYTVLLPFTNGPWTASVALGQGGIKSSVEACQKYWWRNMLYINNLFGNSAECYPIAWYLAVDTQLYIFAPIFLITLYISPIVGNKF